MKNFFKDFKKFITRGNVIDMAIGVVIGSAFSAITTSLVNDIIMPPLGFLIGGVDFKDLNVVIKPAEMDGSTVIKEAVTWNYGSFIQAIINFLLIAFVLFLFLKLFMSVSNAIRAGVNDMKLVDKNAKKEEKARMRAEGKSKKEISARMKEMKLEAKNRKKEEISLANTRKNIISDGTEENNVLLDIRNLLIKDIELKGVNSSELLTPQTNKYFALLEEDKQKELKKQLLAQEETNKNLEKEETKEETK